MAARRAAVEGDPLRPHVRQHLFGAVAPGTRWSRWFASAERVRRERQHPALISTRTRSGVTARESGAIRLSLPRASASGIPCTSPWDQKVHGGPRTSRGGVHGHDARGTSFTQRSARSGRASVGPAEANRGKAAGDRTTTDDPPAGRPRDEATRRRIQVSAAPRLEGTTVGDAETVRWPTPSGRTRRRRSRCAGKDHSCSLRARTATPVLA